MDTKSKVLWLMGAERGGVPKEKEHSVELNELLRLNELLVPPKMAFDRGERVAGSAQGIIWGLFPW
jgi:hypothetical protein